nr:hypothetical protein CFP56_13419 [Quercus suber]
MVQVEIISRVWMTRSGLDYDVVRGTVALSRTDLTAIGNQGSEALGVAVCLQRERLVIAELQATQPFRKGEIQLPGSLQDEIPCPAGHGSLCVSDHTNGPNEPSVTLRLRPPYANG